MNETSFGRQGQDSQKVPGAKNHFWLLIVTTLLLPCLAGLIGGLLFVPLLSLNSESGPSSFLDFVSGVGFLAMSGAGFGVILGAIPGFFIGLLLIIVVQRGGRTASSLVIVLATVAAIIPLYAFELINGGGWNFTDGLAVLSLFVGVLVLLITCLAIKFRSKLGIDGYIAS